MSDSTTAPEQRTAAETLGAWLDDFNAALRDRDASAAAGLFAATSFWRDLIALTWNITTVEGRDGVREMLQHTLASAAPGGFEVSEPPTEADGVTEAWLTFGTRVGRGVGHLRLRDGQAFTLLTTLAELTGHEEPRGRSRPLGAEHGIDADRESWLERRHRETAELGYGIQPEVVIIGGGQGGIALAARLRQLDVATIVVDRHANPGDQWRGRYKSLCLHDPVWYDHLPYIKFPDNWPVFSPKDKIADWLEAYTRVMELNYWGSTTARSASYDEAAGEWTVLVDRDGDPVTLRPRQLVIATGVSGKPNRPTFPGQGVFAGEQQHSSEHPGPDAYANKQVVVVGSNNSAFDICGALYEARADVTMVQRSSTHIVRSETLMDVGLKALYSEEAVANGVTTERADLIFASLPYRIMHVFQIPLYDEMRERDQEFYDRLEQAGFEHDWGEDGSGLFMKYLRRGSGYYIDVGAADLVADGRVKLAHGQVDHLTEHTVVLHDGTELPADLVVYATGYGSMNGWAADLISQEVADRVGKVWGLGSDTTKDPGPWEGEQRNMWKPTQQPGLWFHGGNLHQSRHYSLYLALQLKARAVGIDTPVYGLQEVHHVS
ncbi:MAG TPA: NAD(P)/FAD-dependent oxidoreductase [Solirubrobacteraceae bacterium]|jgi:putative flavoprotein involved in K+ transport|nr:NAD(P)/FAD-dependent oxidoreductase [Solirubrobacteraceae bacterium]